MTPAEEAVMREWAVPTLVLVGIFSFACFSLIAVMIWGWIKKANTPTFHTLLGTLEASAVVLYLAVNAVLFYLANKLEFGMPLDFWSVVFYAAETPIVVILGSLSWKHFRMARRLRQSRHDS